MSPTAKERKQSKDKANRLQAEAEARRQQERQAATVAPRPTTTPFTPKPSVAADELPDVPEAHELDMETYMEMHALLNGMRDTSVNYDELDDLLNPAHMQLDLEERTTLEILRIAVTRSESATEALHDMCYGMPQARAAARVLLYGGRPLDVLQEECGGDFDAE